MGNSYHIKMATLRLSVLILLLCFISTKSSPILRIRSDDIFESPDPDSCQLPKGQTGKVQFLEDCPTLSPDLLPIPPPDRTYGTHALVCCPPKANTNAICFPTDTWCSSTNNGGGQTLNLEPFTKIPTMADEDCRVVNGKTFFLESIGRNLSTCVHFEECEQLLNLPNSPQTSIIECGFDKTTNNLKICCPKDYIRKPRKSRKDANNAIFPDKKGRPRPCKDRHDQCSSWRHLGGCKLDQHLITENFHVFSTEMFRLMELSCMKTCGWCGYRGCVDDHPKCKAWTKQGMCVHNPMFMAHTCRESCGLCGFLANDDSEEQVIGSSSFSFLSRDNFVCGVENLHDIEELDRPRFVNDSKVVDAPEEEVEVYTSTPDDICGATLITDKWCIGAAHCFDDFSSRSEEKIQTLTIKTERESEVIDVKRVFKHPGYEYPHLYNDIALLFHGRRIHFNYDEYQDSPVCLDMNKDHEGEIGDGEAWRSGKRLFDSKFNGMARIISNDLCKEYLNYNISMQTYKADTLRSQVRNALPSGLDYGLLCAIGLYDAEIDRFSGPCPGDSGGSLVVKDKSQKKTFVGIVSGGLGCGQGYPGWYTKVASYVEWIFCVMDKTVELDYDYGKVEQACKEVAELEKRKNKL